MRRSIVLRLAPLLVAALAATACLPLHVRILASDDHAGREAGTPGGAAARAYLLDLLEPLTTGVVPSAVGRAAYQQRFPTGTNVLGLIEGTGHPDEVVVVGAHYDHLGLCGEPGDNDLICNGATDNATGVALLLELAGRLAADPPDRSVLLAFWDAEEKGLAGSRYFGAHPLVPVERIVTYVNVDLVGADLLPSLTNTSFAVGAETGGPALVDAVQAAIDTTSLDVAQLSVIFGAGRSDHVAFIEREVPVVYFSDSTGGCYHTPGDEYEVVNFTKLARQDRIVEATVRALADGGVTPTYRSTPLVTYDDLLGLLAVVERSTGDLDRFPPEARAVIVDGRAQLEQLRGEGRGAFGDDDVLTTLLVALGFVDLLADQPCDGAAGS